MKAPVSHQLNLFQKTGTSGDTYHPCQGPLLFKSSVRKILLGVSSSKTICCVEGPGSDKGKPSASSLITCQAGVLPVDQHLAMPDDVCQI